MAVVQHVAPQCAPWILDQPVISVLWVSSVTYLDRIVGEWNGKWYQLDGMIDGYILVIGASVKHATIVEAPVRSSHWCRYWSCNCNCKWYMNDFSWKIQAWTRMWAIPWFAKWSMSASWSLCGRVWNPIVVADTCLLVLFTKKTTYEQFSGVYLAPKSGTDSFTSLAVYSILGCPKKKQKSEFWYTTYPTGFHRLDEPPEKNQHNRPINDIVQAIFSFTL